MYFSNNKHVGMSSEIYSLSNQVSDLFNINTQQIIEKNIDTSKDTQGLTVKILENERKVI